MMPKVWLSRTITKKGRDGSLNGRFQGFQEGKRRVITVKEWRAGGF
jgi:hypothetical protein